MPLPGPSQQFFFQPQILATVYRDSIYRRGGDSQEPHSLSPKRGCFSLRPFEALGVAFSSGLVDGRGRFARKAVFAMFANVRLGGGVGKIPPESFGSFKSHSPQDSSREERPEKTLAPIFFLRPPPRGRGCPASPKSR